MDGGAWWAAVHGVTKSQTRQSNFTHFSLSCLGEGNGNPLQCSCLENPRDGGAWWLPSMESHRVRHDWSDLAAAAEAQVEAHILIYVISLVLQARKLRRMNDLFPHEKRDEFWTQSLAAETVLITTMQLTPLNQHHKLVLWIPGSLFWVLKIL